MKNLPNIFHCDPTAKVTLPKVSPYGLEILYESGNTEVDNDNIIITTEYENGLPILPFSLSEIHLAGVTEARILCEPRDGFKPVYELTLNVKNISIADNFNPGDTIGVIPKNSIEDVNLILNQTNSTLKADLQCIIKNCDVKTKSQIPKHIPIKSTLRHILTCCVELRAVLKKLFCRALADYCSKNEEKKCLELMCSKEGSELYIEHILNKSISLLDILKEFPSCKPTIPCLLTYLPRLLPRPYSIVNSKLSNINNVKICFSVAEITPGKKGLTTEWLQEIANEVSANASEDLIENLSKLTIRKCENEVKIPIYLRKNLGFTFPNETEKILMVGPGTGVAPFIGFLEERSKMLEMGATANFGETWLFFGCRDGNVDHIYKKELEDFLSKKILTKISSSFSRTDTKYVQDAIILQSREVSDFIMTGAYIFVCGDLSKMVKQVEEAFTLCLENHADKTHNQAVDYVKQLQKKKKYLTDVWS